MEKEISSSNKILNYTTLTTATCFLDNLRPTFESPIEYQIPSTNSSNQQDLEQKDILRSSSATANTIQPNHSSQSKTLFLNHQNQNPTSFIRATVINNGYTLELRWFNSVKSNLSNSLDNPSINQNTCHQPIQFHFNDLITPTPFISLESDPQSNSDQSNLIIIVLTETYTLYRLKFSSPNFFYSQLFDQDWCSEFEVEAIINRQIILSHAIDVNNFIISCSDGILTHLSWGKLIGIDDTFGWKTSNLTTKIGIWNFLPYWNSSKTISSSAHEWVATPTTSISIASFLNHQNPHHDGWLFTFGRDQNLRVWNLTTGLCSREFSLNQFLDQSSNSKDSKRQSPLLPAAPRNLLKFIPSQEGDDPTYQGFLLVFIPSTFSPCFLTFGLSITSDHRFRDLILLEKRNCNLEVKNQSKIYDLRDFQVSKVDLTSNLTTSPTKQRSWSLWLIWDDGLGGEGILEYTILHETKSWSTDLIKNPWIVVQPPNRGIPWNSTYFDELLLKDSSSSIIETFIDHLFRPGHFSSSDLEYALSTYQTHLESHSDSNLIPQVNNDLSFESLEEKICSLVGSNVQLEISAISGLPLIDVYHRKLKLEWLKFATMCSESRASALWPLELTIDDLHQQIFVMGRRSITSPVVIDTMSLLCQIAQAENQGQKPLLLDQQVLEIDQFHPLLSNLNNRIDLSSLITIINQFIDNFSHNQVIKPFEDDLIQIVQKPMKFSVVDIIEDLFTRRLESFIDDNIQIKISESLQKVKDLELTLQLLWNILSTSELIKSNPDDESDEVNQATILSKMLMSDYLINVIERRYELTRNTIIFLICIYGQEQVDQMFSEFSSLTCRYLTTFHQALMSRWICRECSKISSELAFEVEDKLADRLVGLHVSNSGDILGHPEGVTITEANSAASLLSSLISTRFIPEFSTHLKLPGSIASASSRFLENIGLFRNLSRLTDEELSRIKMIESSEKVVGLGYFFLQVGLVSVGLDWIEMVPDAGCGIEYIKGLAYLQMGLIEDAENSFIRAGSAIYDEKFEIDDRSGLRLVLSESAKRNLRQYFSHIVSLFEPLSVNRSVSRFCQLALESNWDESEKEKHEDEGLVLELWNKSFKAYVHLGLWDDAYETLMSIPSFEHQHDSLRTLVSNMCEANEVDRLLRFNWNGLQAEFERTLSFRARNSDSLAVPNYYSILYAYHMNKGDYRSAAIAMYHHGRKVGETVIKGGAFQLLMTQQCQSYLAAINALSLVPEKHAWVPLNCPKFTMAQGVGFGAEAQGESSIKKDSKSLRRRKRLNYFIPEEEFSNGTSDVEILRISDIRQEYTLVLSRLQLANELPQLSQPGSTTTSAAYLDGDTLVPMFVNQGRVTEALEKATMLGTDVVPIFVSLTESCCRLTIEGPEGDNIFDSQWVNGDPISSDWDGSVVNKAWRLLQVHLERKFPIEVKGEIELEAWRCREIVLEAILKTNRSIKAPAWLLNQFMTHRPDRLLKLFFKYDLLQDAFTVAIHIIEHIHGSKRESSRSGLNSARNSRTKRHNIPYSDLDQLLNLSVEDLYDEQAQEQSGEEINGNEMMNEIKLKYYQEKIRNGLNQLGDEIFSSNSSSNQLMGC